MTSRAALSAAELINTARGGAESGPLPVPRAAVRTRATVLLYGWARQARFEGQDAVFAIAQRDERTLWAAVGHGSISGRVVSQTRRRPCGYERRRERAEAARMRTKQEVAGPSILGQRFTVLRVYSSVATGNAP